MANPLRSQRSPLASSPSQIAIIYLIFGLSWIVFTDLPLLWMGMLTFSGFIAATGKGILYVVLSTVLVFVLVRQHVLKLVRAHSLLSAVMDGAADAMFVKDLEGKYLLFNRAAECSADKKADEVLGQDDTFLFSQDSAIRQQEQDRRIIKYGLTETEEETFTTAATARTFLTTKAPYRDLDGNIVGVVGVSRDISEQKRTEKLLREKEAFATGILDSMTAHIAVLDSEGVIRRVNRRWTAFASQNLVDSSHPSRTEVGANYLSVCEASAAPGCEDAAIVARGIRSVLSRQVERFTIEYPCHSQDEHRWFLLSATPLNDQDQCVVISHLNITDRKMMEESLRSSERRFRDLGDAIPQIVWTAATDGELTYLNAKATEYSGLNTDQLTGWSWEHVIHPEDLAATLQRWHETLASGRPNDIAFRIRNADGIYRWHITRQVPARNAAGQIVAWYGTCTDIEDLKQTQNELYNERTLLRTLIDSLPDLIFAKDKQARFSLCNQASVKFAGLKHESELIGKSVFDIFPQDHALNYERDDLSVIQSGDAVLDREELAVDSTGRVSWRLVNKVPLRSHAGEIIGLVGISRNIQKRKEQEQLLADSQERLNLALAAAKMGTWDWDLRKNTVIRSEKCSEILGMSSTEGTFAEFLQLIHPEDVDIFERTLRDSISNRTRFELEFRINRPDGVRWLHRIGSVQCDETGVPIRMVGVIHDITDRRQNEAALRASETRLRLFVEHVSAPIAMFDDQMRYLYVSRRWMTDYQLSKQDIIGHCHYDVFPDIPDHWKGCHQRCLNGAIERCDEERFVRSDGAVQWLRWEVRPWMQSNGTIGGIFIFSEDITQRKVSEQALKDRERLLGIVTGSVRVGLVVVSDQYEYLFANEAYAEIFGLDPKSVAGHRVPELLAPGWSQIQPRLDQAMSGQRVTYELTLPSTTNATLPRWFRVMYEPRQAESGERSVVVVVLEVTEQKRTEIAIKESEERYKRLVEVMPGALYVHTGTEVTFCNPAFVHLMGASSADELIGKNPFEIAHPDFHIQIKERISHMTKSGLSTPGIEMQMIRLDRRAVPVYSVETPIPNADKPAFLVALSDLTERERSVNLLHTVMGSVNDAILTINSRGIVQMANPATERMFGYPVSQLIGGNIRKLMPEPYQSEHDSYLQNFIRSRIAKVIGIGREVTGKKSDGTTFPLELTVTEFQLESAQHFTGVLRDITARKRLEAQFLQSQKMEAVGRLAGGIAHDFNNLLTIIIGYSDLILEDLTPDDINREGIMAVRDAGERAARLTQQLLAFSRKAVIEPKIVDLNELVEESAKLFRRLIGEDILLSVVADPHLHRIKADPGQLEQVIMNLVVNARDAMQTGGRLTIETKNLLLEDPNILSARDLPAGRYVRLSVSDTGHGMADEVKEKIFEPFFTTKGVGKGTGLGLAVVHGVMQQCGGHVSVASKPGQGTAFELLFPVAIQSLIEVGSDTLKIASRGTELVLLVEDEHEVRTIARIALETQGFKVIDASDGQSALNLVEQIQHQISILVTDVVMHGMGGRVLAESLKQKHPNLRVLYMSGYTDDAVVHHGIVQARDAFIQKPFTPLGLARKVRSVLDGTP